MAERPLPLEVQAEGLRRLCGLDARVRKGLLHAEGSVRPSPATDAYVVRVGYGLGKPPNVWVLQPPLRRRTPDERIPHVYEDAQGVRPCLYYPPAREWRPSLPLADTLLPWLLEWLVFYEVWLATGAWLGGGVDHGGIKRAG